MRLVEWSAFPIRIPYLRPVTWASTAAAEAAFLLLRLVADDGRVGLAEGGVNPAPRIPALCA